MADLLRLIRRREVCAAAAAVLSVAMLATLVARPAEGRIRTAAGHSAGPALVTRPLGQMRLASSGSGGTTWVDESVPAGTDPLYSISCPTASECVAVGDLAGVSTHQILTTDGGSTWSTIAAAPSPASGSFAISCSSVSRCVVSVDYWVGSVDDFYVSNLFLLDPLTGSWTEVFDGVSLDDAVPVNGVWCQPGAGSAAQCVALLNGAGTPTNQGIILTSTDGGATWSETNTVTYAGEQIQMGGVTCFAAPDADNDGDAGLDGDSDGDGSGCVATGTAGSSTGLTVWTSNLFGTESVATQAVGEGAVSCGATTSCLIGAGGDYLESYGPANEDGSSYAATAPGGFDDVLCVSATTCGLVGNGIWTTTGAPGYTGGGHGTALSWTSETTPSDFGTARGIACAPSGGACFAVGYTSGSNPQAEILLDTGDALVGPPPVPAAYLAGGSPCPCSPGAGVVTPTGDFYLTGRDATVATYGPSLDFTRTYDALVAKSQADAGAPGPLGFGWTGDDLSYLKLNSPATGDVTVVGPTGGQTEFDLPVTGGGGTACPQAYQYDPSASFASGSYCAASYVTAGLTYDSTSQDYTLVSHPYAKQVFNSSGQLISLTDAAGESETLAYPAGGSGGCPAGASSCVVVTAANGRVLTAELQNTQPSGDQPYYEVTSVVDPLGRTVSYGYCTPSTAGEGTTCLPGDLISVTGPPTPQSPSGAVTTFTFHAAAGSDLAHELVSVSGPNAQPGGPDAGDALTLSYDGSNRVQAETDPMGRQTAFNYSGISSGTGNVVVIDGDGFETNDVFAGNVETSTTADFGGSAPATTTVSPNFSTLETVQSVDPNLQPRSFAYDGNGNTASATSPLAETGSSYENSSDQPLCTSTPLAVPPTNAAYPGNVCASLSAAGDLFAPVTAGQSFGPAPRTTDTSPAPPPVGVTYDRYDSNGDLVWSETGIFAPGGSTATAERIEYTLYKNESVQPTGFASAVSCTTQPPATDLPCASINPLGTVTQYAYDSAGDLTSETVVNANGSANAVTTHAYDGGGEPTSTTSPLGNVSGADAALYRTTTIYDGAGEAVATTSGLPGTVLGNFSSTSYDANGNATGQQNALFETTTTAYNADDEASLVTDADGHSSLTCFDGLGQVVTTVPPDGVGSLTPSSCRASSPWGLASPPADATTTAYSFGSSGRVVTTTAPSPAGQSGGETTTQYYDPAGNLAETVSPPLGVSSGYDTAAITTYDSDGRPLAVTDGLQWNTTSGAFSTTGATTTTASCYDAAGRRIATIPGDGNTATTVSSAGVVSGFVTCTNGSTTSAYATVYTYDSVGDELSAARPVTASTTATWTYTFNPDGTVASTDTPAGSLTDTFYNPDGQVADVTYQSEAIRTFGYDVAGERTSMTDAGSQSGSQSTYLYDPAGNLASVTNEAGQTVSYGYDAAGQLGAVNYPLPGSASWATSDTVDYGRDAAGLVTSMTDLAGKSVAVTNDHNGNPTQLNLPTSTPESVTIAYDNTAAADDIVLVPTAYVGQSSHYQLEFSYSDKPPGEVATETDTPAPSCSRTYTYNAAAEVTKFGPSGSCQLSYGYDASGNPTTLPNGTTAVDKVGSELCWSGSGSGACGSPPSGAISYSYNADEDLTAESGGATVTATWSTLFDQLGSYSDAAANMSSATYDGDGLRIADTVGSTSQNFAWDEVSSSVPRLIVDGTNAYLYADGGTAIEQIALSSGSASYLVADKLGSVRGVVASSGSLSASTAYDPWGNPSSTGGLTGYTPFGFAGGYTDPTGLVYLLARYYSPTSGQFLSVDPAVDQTGQPFAYARNDPVNQADPSGEIPSWRAIRRGVMRPLCIVTLVSCGAAADLQAAGSSSVATAANDVTLPMQEEAEKIGATGRGETSGTIVFSKEGEEVRVYYTFLGDRTRAQIQLPGETAPDPDMVVELPQEPADGGPSMLPGPANPGLGIGPGGQQNGLEPRVEY